MSDIIDINDISQTDIFNCDGFEVVTVTAYATGSSSWNSGVCGVQVSHDGFQWVDAITDYGTPAGTLSADGAIDNIYVGDVRYARFIATTAASTSTYIEPRWTGRASGR